MPKPLFIPNHHWFSLADYWKTGAGRILRLDVSLSVNLFILCSALLDTRALLSYEDLPLYIQRMDRRS